MSRFLLPFFSFAILFFFSSFSPSVIQCISKQHQNSHRPFSSEISKRNVIACKASTFLPSTFLLWEVYLSWLFLVSDSFFSFFSTIMHQPLTHSLPYCTNDGYLPIQQSAKSPPSLPSQAQKSSNPSAWRYWVLLVRSLSLSLISSLPLPSIFTNHPPPKTKKNRKKKRKKLTQFNSSFFVSQQQEQNAK